MEEKTEEKKDSWRDIVKFVIITAAIVLPIRFFIAQPFMVSGPSMEPTFMNNDYLIVDEISYRFEKPKRGDVIIFKRAGDTKYLIKRIIGLPGDTVTLDGNTVAVSNADNPTPVVVPQSYIADSLSEPKRTITLDAGHYFVLGDNRPVSYDSRAWGPLEASAIVGRPFLRLYPFNSIGIFPGDESALDRIGTAAAHS